ncbi:MAG: DUF6531 domain-containing protein [Halioglobus sp.]
MKSGLACSLALLAPTLALGQSSSPEELGQNGVVTAAEIIIAPDTELLVIEQAASTRQVTGTNSSIQPLAGEHSYSAGERNYSARISFAEFPDETPISDQYRDRGIIFGGSTPTTTTDIAIATPPVLAGTPLFQGDITGRFVIPGTDQPAPVYQFTWDIGHFDSVGSVEMAFFGPQGQLLYSSRNEGTGSYRYAARGGNIGIASWRMHVVSDEPGGFGIDNVFFSIPGKDDLGREMGLTDCLLGNPVNPAAGNKVQQEQDYLGHRPFPLAAIRTYNSISGQWTFFPSIRHLSGTIEAQVTRPDGKVISFTGGMGMPDWRNSSTDVTEELSSEIDGFGNIIGWRVKTLDDQIENYDANGRLTSVSQRSGLHHSYSYDLYEILVQHSLGGDIRYMLDTAGRITGFTDPAGQHYSYTYNADEMLVTASYPASAGGRTYHYENVDSPDLLTGISDSNGDRFASWTYDSARRAIVSEHNNGANRVSFDYSYLNGPGTSRTTATNALGKQTSYHYTKVNGIQRVFRVEGHPSENCIAANQQYTFDSRAFIRSKTDWNGNVTDYVRDSKGRELVRREAVGTALERTTNTDWHSLFNLPVRIIEQGRETQYNYDIRGNLKSMQVMDTGNP